MEEAIKEGFQSFVEFYKFVANPENIDLLRCPACGEGVRIIFAPSFNINVYGKATIICMNDECEFHKNPIVIDRYLDRDILIGRRR